MDDATMFKTGNTCALIVPVMMTVYSVTIFLSLVISLSSFILSMKQTVLRNRGLLLSNSFACFMTGVFAALHWAEGYTLGYVSTIVFTTTLLHLNIQVGYVEYLIFSILIKVSQNHTQRLARLRRGLGMWNGFWWFGKLILLTIFFGSHFSSNANFWNFSVFLVMIFVFVEVMCQSLMTWYVFEQIYANLIEAGSVAEMTGTQTHLKRQQVEVFGRKMLGQTRIIYYYAIVIGGITATIIILFFVFDFGRIPFAWTLFAGYVVTWPTLCLGPIGLLQESVVQSNGKVTSSDATPRGAAEMGIGHAILTSQPEGISPPSRRNERGKSDPVEDTRLRRSTGL
jgi:hypothetical protein